ncbi:MAG TPA: radical SAM protein [Chitinophagales bacterium]|nr:radical SAM protein [Chitinophagales bacterium]
MSKRVLFTHSYFMRFDPKQWAQKQPYPPLATILAAAVLREKGYAVRLFDTMFAQSPDEVLPHLQAFKPDYLVIYDDGFNYLTKMCLTNMREAAWKMSEYAHAAGCKVIVSSSDSTDHYDKYLQHNADVIILGEAEQTLSELVENFVVNEDVKGIAFVKDGAPVKTPPRTLMKNISDLPLPAWDLVDIEAYRQIWLSRWGYFSLNIATTRGCPYKCNWCAKPIYGNSYTMRTPEHVVKEIKMLQEKYRFDHIWFCDDIYGMRRNWVIEFAELVKMEGLKFRYKIQSRADLLVQEKYVEALADSGCESVWMGAESGSQKVLDAMDKGTTIAQIKEATKLLKQYGIKPAFFLQFGYLGETIQDIKQTIDMLNECLPDDMGASVSYPLPGTGFYEKVKGDMQNKTNWTDSDELALMFSNTYKADFYKQLHRYVHKNYRLHQGYESIGKLLSSFSNLNYQNLRRAAAIGYYLPTTFLEKQKLKNIEYEAAAL